ncbi:iron-siderophore ABC transporter substrate-binding protein [Pseudonocardia sp. WMMC193]|uniref:iron-siderophore ABC transporter substrate-binding protein n=1 Tax=Pseudonocardia sp. WMMC193 TaxID=2911965 RepID=UPI001F1CEB9F|nr:iron-siderophore ABC transporter substrate-binding protein [Pseudonocardia sp. WMMC193]MCF7551521.1 iron-siderophore ABC transporter substrate-binding protein [Pseudonocardia sp. WMMC193]
MRRFLPFILLCGLLLAGCASAPEPGQGSGGVTIEHVFGRTTVPPDPVRVVTLGVTDADAVLALGVTPVALTGYGFYGEQGGLGPWARPLVQGSPVLLDSTEPDLEQIARLAPDLIVGVSAGFEQDVYDRLSAIAPTVARPVGTVAYAVPRDDQTRVIARALGREADGERLIAQANAAFAEAVAANPGFAGRTGTAVLPYDGKYGAYTPGDSRGQVMAALGFSLPPAVAARDTGERFYVEVAPEQAGIMDGDVLVMLADQPAARAAVDADPVLQQLPVVTDGRMVVPDLDTRGAMTYNSVLSVPYALDSLVPQLAAAVSKAG